MFHIFFPIHNVSLDVQCVYTINFKHLKGHTVTNNSVVSLEVFRIGVHNKGRYRSIKNMLGNIYDAIQFKS